MRIAALVVTACLAGCSLTSGGGGSECQVDPQCGDEVCANSGECMARSSVREYLVRWTVNGVAANEACANLPNLFLRFEGTDYGDILPFAPVACSAGQLRLDKLPKRYQQVELGFEGSTGEVSAIDAGSTQVQFDLIR
jgi:hypothetical protein